MSKGLGWFGKVALVSAMCCCSAVSHANDIEKQIDTQLWDPFIESWKTMNGEQNAALHTRDVVRVIGQMGKIFSGSDYLQMNTNMMDKMRKQGVTSMISFRFKSRVNDDKYAWQRGIYQAVMHHPEKGEMISYAEFDVILEKVNDHWKIKVDRDYPASEQDFNQLPASAQLSDKSNE